MGAAMAAKRKRIKRSEIQAGLWRIVNAVLDDEVYVTAAGNVNFVQHQRDPEQFSAYILLDTGELDENTYDVLRDIVNENGGSLHILDRLRAERQNATVRIWLRKED
jgi:hypothetical protein